jgi:hypothetical protein
VAVKLEAVFERVVVINLPFKADRRRRLERHFAQREIVNPRKVLWERAICGDWTPPPAWWGAGHGAWGCLMSHVRVAQDAAHDKLASYCVLEDDVVFHPRANEMLECFVRELPPDWGQVYLGGQFLHQEPQRISQWVMQPFNVNRTHAFALSSDTVSQFLQHVMHAPDYFSIRADEEGTMAFDQNCFHIDHQLGRAHEIGKWKTYAPIWWLVGQEGGSSSISGRTNPRLWWHWRERGHGLPFFFVESSASQARRKVARRYIHPGNNLLEDTLIDIGLDRELSDDDLLTWLKMIAGEAIELWKLPGFEVPDKYPDILDRVRRLWNPGLVPAEQPILAAVADYPFNGFLGGLPQLPLHREQ